MPETDSASSTNSGKDLDLVPFRMPSLGADMDSGTIIEWLVGPGAEVRRGDVVALVQTDKSDLDVEVFHDGTIAEILVPAGVKVPVGTVLAMLAAPGAAVESGPTAETAPVVETGPPPLPPETPEPRVLTLPSPEPLAHIASPVLRHLAETLHVDTGHLHGSGTGGRITRDDIEHAGQRRRVTPRARRLAREQGVDLTTFPTGGAITGDSVLDRQPSGPPTAASQPAPSASPRGPDPEAMRRAIARLMTTSWQTIPHYQVATRIDLHLMLDALEQRNAGHTATERILPAAALVRAAARAAASVTGVNGFWIDDAFVPGDGVHIGVVVALRRGGLLAPVVRDADRKDLVTIMAEMRDLVTRARTGRLKASEVGGATFTITELGEGGVDSVAPIIHPPQVAILGFGAVHDEAWAEDGMIAVRAVVHATLAGDHRAIDGRIGSAYLTTLTKYLQEPLES